jgi:PhnB protein
VPKRSPAEQLDQAISALLSTSQPLHPRVAALVSLVHTLRAMPRPEFKASLKSELQRRISMKQAAAVPSPAPSRAIQFRRPNFPNIAPYFLVDDAPRFIDFLVAAFEGAERIRVPRPDDSIMHAEVAIGNSVIELGDANEQYPQRSMTTHLYVPDADATFARALQAGAASIYAPTDDHPSGDRWGAAISTFATNAQRSRGRRSSSLSVRGLHKCALAEGPDGDLWIGTTAGLVRIPRVAPDRFDRSLSVFYHLSAGISDEITCLQFSRNGALWVGTGAGLYRFGGNRFETVISLASVSRIEESADGYLLIISGQGFIELDGTRVVEHPGLSDQLGIHPDGFYHVFQDRQGAVWFCTSVGLARRANGSIERFQPTESQDTMSTECMRILREMYGCCRKVGSFAFPKPSWSRWCLALP